ncbi:alpha-amylase family protein [Cohnella rhizosphaerae]|uniref:alpha-L-fucosidase n=1 Tax=Cohnella rhizosphaerae TaxID=1457232 RepID=A0A9X4QRN2_9BACL|nr:alpha-amylase family protein [Cohnella rhizosphaerae]MDG0809231.1 alpha-L-fucosidase [Cohnella rhizosphaerae]
MMDRKHAFLGLHFDLHPTEEDDSLGADVTEERVDRLLRRVRPDYVHYDCKGHPGYTGCPVRTGWAAPGIVRDSLAVWREATRKLGISLGIHYSGVVDHLAVRRHPEWARQDAEGQPDAEATSVFGPYADELMIPQLQEIVARYGLDSIWLDGECWGAKLDYSPAALTAWREATGWEDAPAGREDPRWLQWKNFHRAAFENYLRHWTEALHRAFPKLQVASNWAYTTMSPKPVAAGIDYISGDFDPMLSADRARTETRYLSNVGMPWELQAWGFDNASGQEELLKSPSQLKQEAGVVLMHGGGFMMYFLPTRSGYINEEIEETAAEVAAFCRARKRFSHRSVSVPQVALLHSSESQFDRSDRVFTWWDTPLNELEGALHALLESHYSVDILAEHMLESRLEEFALLVIPDAHALSDAFRRRVLDYVAGGGKLLLLGERCVRLFGEALGAELLGEPRAANAQLVSPAGKVGCPGLWQRVEATTAETVAMRYEGEGVHGRHSYLDTRSEGVSAAHLRHRSEEIAATVNRYGAGEVAAVYGPVADRYFHSHHPALRSWIRRLAERLFPEPAVKTDAPSCVDLALRRTAEGELCVHLLNLANMPVSNRRAYAEYVPPIGPIRLGILLDSRPSAVVWEPGGASVDWHWSDGKLEASVPKLDIHGALVIRFS